MTAPKNSSKTIAIVSRELRTSTGRYADRLLHYLQQIDTVNHYKILLKPEDIDSFEITNSNFEAIPCPYPDYTFKEQIGLKKQLDALKPDLVHFTMTQQPIFYRGKTVTTMHDLTLLRFRNPEKNQAVLWVKQRVFDVVNWVVLQKSKRIFTPTEYVRHDLIERYNANPEKIITTLESADRLAETSESFDALKNKQFIMFVGQAFPHKNLSRLVDAFEMLQSSHPDLHLVLVGKKSHNHLELEKSIKRRGIKNVLFTGFTSDAKLAWLYEHTACYCFPSLSEGFGLPGLEAMLHGAPVASSNATCLPEVYGNAAAYFDPVDITAMRDTIHAIITDPELRSELINSGAARVKQFSWKKMATTTHKHYQDSLSE